MRRNNIFQKTCALLVTLTLIFSSAPTIAYASTLPSAYSSVEKGYVTSVKTQNPWGACWTFSAIACMESYAISHGYANSSLDLSEYALAELTYNDQGFESQTGDYTTINSGLSFADCLASGGNYSVAFKALNKWAGIYQEYEAPYDNNSSDGATWYDMTGKKPTFYLTGMTMVSTSDIEAMKRAIMANGAVGANCNSNDAYEKDVDGYNSYYIYNYAESNYNHAITIVGWNDNIPATSFTINGHTPSRNGGWLVKNSWGTTYGKGGYQWMSYDDLGLLASTGVVYEVAPSNRYDYNYQHDGATQMSGATLEQISFANVFTVPNTVSSHRIEAVAFGIHSDYRSYSIQIYELNAFGDNPLTGTALLTTPVTGTTGREGYYTINLPNSVTLASGSTFAVVITFDQKTAIWCSTGNWAVGTSGTTTCSRVDGQSFYGDGSYMKGYNKSKYDSNFCLKAFACDPSMDGKRETKAIVPSQTVDPTPTDNQPTTQASTSSDINSSNQAEDTSSGQTEEPVIEILVGDVNGDGIVDLSDMMRLKSHIIAKASLDDEALKHADIDGDGDIDIDDYITLRSNLLNHK